MSTLDRRAQDLRDVVREIMQTFKRVDGFVADGPQAQLSMQELHLLEHLGDGGPRMMRELAEFLCVAVNSITNTVDNLEKKGLVRRLRSDQDRRVVRVELTENGWKVYRGAVKARVSFLRCLLAALNEDEQEIYMVLMRKIAREGRTQVQKMARPA